MASPYTPGAMKSSPASSAVTLVSCRRILHLHLADADVGVDDDVGRRFSRRGQRRVAVDVEPALVLVEEADLAEPGVAVQLDDDVARQADEHVAHADGDLHGSRRTSLEREASQVEPQLADPEV